MTSFHSASGLTRGRLDSAFDPRGGLCDLRETNFVDAFGLVGAAVAIVDTIEADEPVAFLGPSRPEVGRHLALMGLQGFLDKLSVDNDLPDLPVASNDDVVVPLAEIDDVAAVERLSHLLYAQLERSVDSQVLVAITEGLWELAANALEHSGSSALIMGQVYRIARGGGPPDHDDKVQIVIGDAGRGVRASFLASGVRMPPDDATALQLSVEYLVSSVDDPGRGQGLATTIEEVAGLGGFVEIRSGNAALITERTGSTCRGVARLPGTLVGISLPMRPGWTP